MKFTIHRETWLRGEGAEGSCLLRGRDGKQCCVGQMLKQLGIPDEALLGFQYARQVTVQAFAKKDQATLDKLEPILHPVPLAQSNPQPLYGGQIALHSKGATFYIDKDVEWVQDCYPINDNAQLRDIEREERLAAIAAKNGHEIVFV